MNRQFRILCTATLLVFLVCVAMVGSSRAQDLTETPTPTATNSPTIPQTGWSLVYVDSKETIGEDGRAINAFDNEVNTIWHTQWMGGSPPPPHEIQIDLGQSYTIDGFRYLPRQDGGINGTIAEYEFYVSQDGVNWGTPISEGTFTANTLEKERYFELVN